MSGSLPDFKARAEAQQSAFGTEGAERLAAAGRTWDLSPSLAAGGSVIFPHIGLDRCGEQIAAAVSSALACCAGKVLALGVLHGLDPELAAARRRVAEGVDPASEPLRGVQGPGLSGGRHWRREFSLSHFQWLWDRLRPEGGPELLVRYPFLAGDRPGDMPGMAELEDLVGGGAAVLATGDLFHHGRAYGDGPGEALEAEDGGLEVARASILDGCVILRRGDAAAWQAHCLHARSDARDTGATLMHLLGPLEGRLLDLSWEDMCEPYGAEGPSWVAGALLELRPAAG